MDFSNDAKCTAFDKIARRYYNRNFGTMSKMDFETMLFDIYIDHLLDNSLPFDDHSMSKALGISQSKIRSLKVRKELQYPRNGFEWKKGFAEEIQRATFDEKTRMVKMMISDVNVLTELRYFMEINGWYDEYQLNPRLFQCRIDFFIQLCGKLSENNIQIDDEAIQKIKELQKQATNSKEKTALQSIIEGSVEEGLKSLALFASKELLLIVLKQIPFGGIAGEALKYLTASIEHSEK